MPKLTLAKARVNDYLRFESLTDAYGMPCGTLASPGDVRYFRITEKIGQTCVIARRSGARITFEDRYLDDDNVHLVEARFPAILNDWRLRVSLPAPSELPWRLRLTRWVLNLFRSC